MNGCCIVCGRKLPKKPLFTLEGAPATAQDIPDNREAARAAGITLELKQCPDCSLVQFDCEPVSYYRDVIRAGGFSTTMTGLRRAQYRHLIGTYRLEGKRFLEVGCGRGEFLKVLTEFPVEAYGMEHRADLVQTARADGLQVWQEFPETAGQAFHGGEKFDVFLSFNFLEHQPEPSVMLRAIYGNLNEGGMGLVTVPALEYIVEQGSYYELLHDHIAYYSFGALRELLRRNGFWVLEEEMLNRDTVAMIVRKLPEGAAPVGVTGCANEAEDAGEEAAFAVQADGAAAAASLARGYEKVRAEISALVGRLAAQGKRLALWGASHQGFTLASTTALCGAARYIIDSAPFKQGRFAPASALPIVAPEHYFEEPVDAVLIVAPGYTDEIAASARAKFGPEVKVLAMRTDRVETFDKR